ncbi:MAG: 3D domain-containing protein [Myxococcales bacterium]|nr:3D domain-containing protein [Myxococcota bacterium]MDW8282508.1 3D domain-containing protein [Myxococcales bacterium]
MQVLLAALLSTLAPSTEQVKHGSKEVAPPQEKLPARGKVKECCGYPLGAPRSFKMTFYWLAWESEYANEPYDTDIYTSEGFFLGRFPRTFVYELRLEGSGILRDGRVLNYDGECPWGVGTCFRQIDPEEYPLGMGAQGRPLEPFRSVAVDPRYIPIGTPLYVPQLVGIRMPDGTWHDGCVRADDTGGGIRRQELDFFVESYANYKYIADNLWWDTAVTPLIEEPRCAYLRRGDPWRDRQNEQTDWLALHKPKLRVVLGRKPGRKRAIGVGPKTAMVAHKAHKGRPARQGRKTTGRP